MYGCLSLFHNVLSITNVNNSGLQIRVTVAAYIYTCAKLFKKDLLCYTSAYENEMQIPGVKWDKDNFFKIWY